MTETTKNINLRESKSIERLQPVFMLCYKNIWSCEARKLICYTWRLIANIRRKGDQYCNTINLLDNLSDCLIHAPENFSGVFKEIQTHDLVRHQCSALTN